MRLKSIDQILLVLMFLLGSFSLFLLFSPENKQNNEVAIGSIVDQINIVKKKGQIFEAWNDVSVGDNLKLNDQVYTHDSSRVELQLNSGRKINVQENSLLKITADLLGEKLELERGTINAVLNDQNKSLNLKIGGKTILLKSGNGVVQIEKTQETSRFFVESGNVEIEKEGARELIKENQMLEADGVSGRFKVHTLSLKTISPLNFEKIVIPPGESVVLKWDWVKKNENVNARYLIQLSKKKSFSEFEEFSLSQAQENYQFDVKTEGKYFWRLKEEMLSPLGQVTDSIIGPIKNFEIIFEYPVIVDQSKNIFPYYKDQKLNLSKITWNDIVLSRLNLKPDFYLIKISGHNYEKTFKTSGTELNWTYPNIGEFLIQVKPVGNKREKATWSTPLKVSVVENTVPEIERLTPAKVELIDYSRNGMKTLVRWKVISGIGNFKIRLSDLSEENIPERLYETDSDFISFDLLKPGAYEWQVQGMDSLGNLGNSISGKIYLKFPRKVTTLPSEGEVVLLETPDQEVSFKWEKIKNVKSYIFELSKNKEFSTIDISSETDKNYFATKLNDVGQYFWRVKMNTSNGIEYSLPVSVEIKPVPILEKPTLNDEIRIKLKSVKDKEILDQVYFLKYRQNIFVKISVKFLRKVLLTTFASNQVAEWSVPSAKNVKKYLVEIYQDKELKKLITRIESDTEVILWKGATSGEFFWRLAYRDSWGRETEYSAPSKMIIDPDELIAEKEDAKSLPIEIKLISPKHHDTFSADTMSFEWEIGYLEKSESPFEFLIAKDLEFSDVVFSRKVSSSKINLKCSDLTNLKGDLSYFWRIKKSISIKNKKMDDILSKRRAITFPCLLPKVLAEKKETLDENLDIDEPKRVKTQSMLKFFYSPYLLEQTSVVGNKRIIIEGNSLISFGGWKQFQVNFLGAKAFELEGRASLGKVFNSENYKRVSIAGSFLFPLKLDYFSFLFGLNTTLQSSYEVLSAKPVEAQATLLTLFGKLQFASDIFNFSFATGVGNSLWFKPQISKQIHNYELSLFYLQNSFENDSSQNQVIETEESSFGFEFSYLF